MANIKKNKKGYGYMYTDLAAIHEYLESEGLRYYQFTRRVGEDDYIMTQKLVKNGDSWVKDGEALQGCRIVQATLSGKANPAQEQRKRNYIRTQIFRSHGFWIIHNRQRWRGLNKAR